jgi:hypothetical protein
MFRSHPRRDQAREATGPQFVVAVLTPDQNAHSVNFLGRFAIEPMRG